MSTMTGKPSFNISLLYLPFFRNISKLPDSVSAAVKKHLHALPYLKTTEEFTAWRAECAAVDHPDVQSMFSYFLYYSSY
jgi:hypothetical protein